MEYPYIDNLKITYQNYSTIEIFYDFNDNTWRKEFGGQRFTFKFLSLFDKSQKFKILIINNIQIAESSDGIIFRFVDEILHCNEKDSNGLTLPAIEWNNGNKSWWKYGEIHRDEKDNNGLTLPAIEWVDENTLPEQRWFQNGLCHRDDKDQSGCILPARICQNGHKEWWSFGSFKK